MLLSREERFYEGQGFRAINNLKQNDGVSEDKGLFYSVDDYIMLTKCDELQVHYKKCKLCKQEKVCPELRKMDVIAHNKSTNKKGFIHAEYLIRDFRKLSEAEEKKLKENPTCGKSFILKIIGIILLMVAVVIAAVQQNWQGTNSNSDTDKLPFNEMMKRFENTYSGVNVGLLERCLLGSRENDGPCVALILYSSFKEDYSKQLALDFADLASAGLETDYREFKNLENDLNGQNLVEFFTQQLKERKVLVVQMLHKLGSQHVKLFHSLCDYYCEKVDKKAVFIFTMLNKSNSDKQSNKRRAEESMASYWDKELEDNILHPLTIRLSENVVYIP